MASHCNEIIAAWNTSQFEPGFLRRWQITSAGHIDPTYLQWHYVKPLLELLVHYLRTGDDNYLLVYLDERLRHAPFNLPQEERCRFFAELLPKDEAAILKFIESPDDRRAASEIWADLHSQLLTVASTPLNLLAVGDCLMNEIRVFLPSQCRQLGTDVDMRYIYFSAAMSASISIDEIADYLKNNRVDLISLSFFSFEGIPVYSLLLRECDTITRTEIDQRISILLGQAGTLLRDVRKLTDTPILLHNVSGLPLRRFRRHIPFLPALSANKQYLVSRLNDGIATICRNNVNCLLIDEQSVGARYGLKKLDEPVIRRSLRSAAFFHTSRFGRAIGEAYAREITSYRKLGKIKLILVDFDNTLWDGVMADGAVTQYQPRQELLTRLMEGGIILAAVTKNSESNIRWHEMTLQKDHFAILKINWNMKAQSIREIGAELNLGFDSFALLDDNPAERALVAEELPTVTMLDAQDPETWNDLERVLQYPNTQQTEEARNRTKMYQVQTQRQQLLESATVDQGQLMRSLGLEMTFRRASAKDIKRVYELVNRTNQFNTTTRRHSENTLQTMQGDSKTVLYVAELKDRFGPLGVVATAIIRERAADTAEFDSLVMSCRAMGFGLENQFLHEIIADLASSYHRFVGLFVPTDRNQPCASVFKQNKFQPVGDQEWHYLVNQPDRIPAMDWIKVLKQ